MTLLPHPDTMWNMAKKQRALLKKVMRVRVSERELERYEEAADRLGVPLSYWVRMALTLKASDQDAGVMKAAALESAMQPKPTAHPPAAPSSVASVLASLPTHRPGEAKSLTTSATQPTA